MLDDLQLDQIDDPHPGPDVWRDAAAVLGRSDHRTGAGAQPRRLIRACSLTSPRKIEQLPRYR